MCIKEREKTNKLEICCLVNPIVLSFPNVFKKCLWPIVINNT